MSRTRYILDLTEYGQEVFILGGRIKPAQACDIIEDDESSLIRYMCKHNKQYRITDLSRREQKRILLSLYDHLHIPMDSVIVNPDEWSVIFRKDAYKNGPCEGKEGNWMCQDCEDTVPLDTFVETQTEGYKYKVNGILALIYD